MPGQYLYLRARRACLYLVDPLLEPGFVSEIFPEHKAIRLEQREHARAVGTHVLYVHKVNIANCRYHVCSLPLVNYRPARIFVTLHVCIGEHCNNKQIFQRRGVFKQMQMTHMDEVECSSHQKKGLAGRQDFLERCSASRDVFHRHSFRCKGTV